MQRRRILLHLAATTALAASALSAAAIDAPPVPEDRDAPMGGNPAGDLAVVAFFDYDCPYCKAAEPQLQRFIAGDGGARLVYRDWPVLGPASLDAARLALAARCQGRYEAAHGALMAARGRRGTNAQLRATLEGAGLDMDRLAADAAGKAGEIESQLARNARFGIELGLRAVPAYLVGGHRIVGGFDVENFRDFAARARAETQTR